MKKTTIWVMVALTLIVTATAIQVSSRKGNIFTTEEEAQTYKNTFSDYPKIKRDANITMISGKLDDSFVIMHWDIIVKNKERKREETLTGNIKVSKADKNNEALIDALIQRSVINAFDNYNNTFIPNPTVEYRDSPNWGKTIKIKPNKIEK